MNYDKSLTEVWEWKERSYQEYKNLTDEESIERIRQNADKLLSEAGVKLRKVNGQNIKI